MPQYLDLEVVLDHVQPPVWRRFLLDERATFLDLHQAIQDACGWENRHLFAFRGPTGEVVAGRPDGFGFGDPDPDAAQVSVADHLRHHAKVMYEYDFGGLGAHGHARGCRRRRRAIHPTPAGRRPGFPTRGLWRTARLRGRGRGRCRR
jgi:hypothetical protein